jgi:hypothetical protein
MNVAARTAVASATIDVRNMIISLADAANSLRKETGRAGDLFLSPTTARPRRTGTRWRDLPRLRCFAATEIARASAMRRLRKTRGLIPDPCRSLAQQMVTRRPLQARRRDSRLLQATATRVALKSRTQA